jgi:hypothetical protein
MESVLELRLFIKELNNLINEFERCSDLIIRNEIANEILLITYAIKEISKTLIR